MKPSEHPFFQSLSEEEKQNIFITAQDIAQLLGCWAPRYPMVRSKRIPPVSVLVAGVLPQMPIDRALLVGKLILMVFALDDTADERLCSLEEFRHKSQLWETVMRSGQTPAKEQDDLTLMFLELREAYAQFPLFKSFSELWASLLRLLCETVAREYEYSLNYQQEVDKSLPSLDEYIQVGLHSVGAPFWSTAILILLSDHSTLEHLDVINEAIVRMGAAMRLYNDLRSYEKELQESVINAVIIMKSQLRKADPLLPEDQAVSQAREAVRRLAAEYAEKSLCLINQIHTETGQFEETIRRTIAFHAHFYGSDQHKKDYHTLSSAESFSMIKEA